MLHAGIALTRVSTEDLRRALRHLVRGDLRAPLGIHDLTRCGLQPVAADLLDALRGLDEAGVRAVLVAVLAERRAAEERADAAR